MTRVAKINHPSEARTHIARVDDRVSRRAVPLRVVVPIDSFTTPRQPLEKLSRFAARHVLLLARLSLALVFFWFGLLKILNVSPVVSLLRASVPFLANPPYLEVLGVVEIGIGTGLLLPSLTKAANVSMILHLLGTFSLFLLAPRLMFAPHFPLLTMDGEFVIKNFVLITSALVILLSRPPQK
jgi:putative oxidoreductase